LDNNFSIQIESFEYGLKD